MHFVYVLQSMMTHGFYVGSTKDVEDRLKRHNSSKKGFTSKGQPWSIVHTITCSSKTEALKLEFKIKKRGIKRYLEDIGISI